MRAPPPALQKDSRLRVADVSTPEGKSLVKALFAPVVVDDWVTMALIDGGAEANLVGEEYLGPDEIPDEGAKDWALRAGRHPPGHPGAAPGLRGYTGHRIPTRGLRWKWVGVGPFRVRVLFHVVSGSQGMILGSPFLRACGVRVDYRRGWLEVERELVPLFQRSKGALVATIKVAPEERPGLPADVAALFAEKLAAACLDEANRRRFEEVMWENVDVWGYDRRGVTNVTTHDIELLTPNPIYTGPRRYSPEQQLVMAAEVEKMLKDGVIRPSRSPYASGVVLVGKPDGSTRFCIDFRPLNRVTKKDQHPLPRIKDLLLSLRGSRHFVALDLKAGYWQIAMKPSAIEKTAFRTPHGLYEFLVMPFGLVNAPATFQRMAEELFNDLRWDGVLVYLDDILVHATAPSRCLELLELVLQRLRAAGLTLNLKKSEFFPRRIRYLGHIVEGGEMVPVLAKVQAIEKLRPPSTLKGVRSVLGLFSYYRDYVPRFAEIAAPIVRLLKKGTVITWGPEQDGALAALQAALKTAVLALPLEGDEFQVETDASDYAVAGVLSVSREGKMVPVEFASSTLTETQRRWATREKEAWAIVWALKKFDPYLRGRTFKVYTDHQSLKWLLASKEGKLARWAQALQEHAMEVHYKKGTAIGHVDVFTRNPEDDGLDDERMVYPIQRGGPWPTTERVIAESAAELRGEPLRGYQLRGGVYWRGHRPFLPTLYRAAMLDYAHVQVTYCHLGVRKTYGRIKKLFVWPGLLEDVRAYVKSCLTCQRTKEDATDRQGTQLIHPEGRPFGTVYMDFWGPVNDPDGQHYWVLTMIDRATRWAETALVGNKEATTAAEAFITSWVSRYGVPDTLVTDNDQAFTGKLFMSLLTLVGCIPVTTSPYHPQGNAFVESFHRHLVKSFKMWQNTYDTIPLTMTLQLVTMAYRAIVHESLGDTPAFITLGVDLFVPDSPDRARAISTEVWERADALAHIRSLAAERSYALQRARQLIINQGRRELKFTEGDLILIPLTATEQRRVNPAAPRKLTPKWSLPYRVLDVARLGQACRCRSLVTGRTRRAHISMAKFIQKPRTTVQAFQWEQEIQRFVRGYLGAEGPEVPDETVRRYVDGFWHMLALPVHSLEEEILRGGFPHDLTEEPEPPRGAPGEDMEAADAEWAARDETNHEAADPRAHPWAQWDARPDPGPPHDPDTIDMTEVDDE